jgi:hypothetical protein
MRQSGRAMDELYVRVEGAGEICAPAGSSDAGPQRKRIGGIHERI